MKKLSLVSILTLLFLVNCYKREFKLDPKLKNPEYKSSENVIKESVQKNGDSLKIAYKQILNSNLSSQSNQKVYIINYYINSNNKYESSEIEKIAKLLNNLTRDNLTNLEEFDNIEMNFYSKNNKIVEEKSFKTN